MLVLFVLRYAVSDFPFGIFKCTFLGDWEKKLLQKSEYLPAQYWRYIDDIWGIWEHGFDKLHEFHNLANSLHSRIKIELRFSSAQIEFLDVNVSINNGHNKTDLFSKDTDKHMYLHVTSSHPNSVKNAIRMDCGLEPRGFVRTRMTIKLDEIKLKTIYGNGGIQMI